jgi:hypothetical protein
MMRKEPSRFSPDVQEHLDQLIEDHFRQAAENSDGDAWIAPVSASDKLHWATRTGLDLEQIDRRLNEISSQEPPPNRFAVAPRYRLRPGYR